MKRIHGYVIRNDIPPPKEQTRTRNGANRELISTYSQVLTGMTPGECLLVDDFDDAERFRNRFTRLASYGRWVIRKSPPGWRIWRVL